MSSSLRRTVSPILRHAVGPLNSMVSNSTLDSPLSRSNHEDDEHMVIIDAEEDISNHFHSNANSNFNNNNIHPINNNGLIHDFPFHHSLSSDPAPSDVATIQRGVHSLFAALESERQLSPAEVSLLKVAKETTADPLILDRIVNNNAFQDFVNMIGQSSLLFGTQPQPMVGNVEHEHIDISSPESSHQSSLDHNDEVPLRRRVNGDGHYEQLPMDRTTEQITLNRLNELCQQISPQLVSGVSDGWKTEQSSSVADNNTHNLGKESSESGKFKPTMEGAGSVPGDASEAANPPPPWANPVYLFVATACVIPLTILAVTAVLHPSGKTFNLLRHGFKAVCNRVFG